MSDDRLERATAALRDTTNTPATDSARQRARLLAHAAKRTKPTPIWQWAAVAFGGLFVSSAMAQLGGYMPMVLRALTHGEAPSAPAPQTARRPSPPSAAPRSPQPSATEPEQPTAPQATTPSAAPEALPPSAATPNNLPPSAATPNNPPPSAATPNNLPPSAATPTGPSRAKAAHPALAPKRAPTNAPAADDAPAQATTAPEALAAPEPDSTPTIAPPPSAANPTAPAAHPPESAELSLFRRAQTLHLAHSPGALAAWDAYLRVAKQGALVPEARYNRALCLVWLRQYGEARAALEPFAQGAYEGYRQAEAQALLARIPE